MTYKRKEISGKKGNNGHEGEEKHKRLHTYMSEGFNNSQIFAITTLGHFTAFMTGFKLKLH